MVSPATTPLFTPDPTQVAAILTDLAFPDHSLADVAEIHHTTIDALSAWAARPEIQDRLRAIETLAAHRARLAAAAHLPLAIGALADMLTAYRADESRTPMRGDLKSIHLAEIRRSNARRAANLLSRLARFSSLPPLPSGEGPRVRAPRSDDAKSQHFQSSSTATHTPVPTSPSLREGAGGRVPPFSGAPNLPQPSTNIATSHSATSVPYDLPVLSARSALSPSDASQARRADDRCQGVGDSSRSEPAPDSPILSPPLGGWTSDPPPPLAPEFALVASHTPSPTPSG